MTDVREYKLKNLLLDKEFCIANANRELDLGGWLSDWGYLIKCINMEIDKLIKEIDNLALEANK